jgi:hypothetical protein
MQASVFLAQLYDKQFQGTKLDRFVNIFSDLDTDRMESVVLSFIKGEEWLKDFVMMEREDHNWTPFLKSIFEKSSSHTANQVTIVLSKIVEKILDKGAYEDDEINVIYEILDLAIYLRWGLSSYTLHNIIDDSNMHGSIREKAGVALALYPLDENLKRYWSSVQRDYKKNYFLIYPLFIAFQSQHYLELFSRLHDADIKPTIHNSFSNRILDVIEKIEEDLDRDPNSFARVLEAIIELPTWLRERLERSTKISFKLKTLNQIIQLFDKYKYRKNKLTKEFYFPEIPIYDLSVLDYINYSKIAEEFGVIMKSLKISIEDLEFGNAVRNGTEMDLQHLLRPEFCKRNKLSQIQPGNFLIVMPRQLVSESNKESGVDLAISNLFRHSFVLNTSIDELFEQNDKFSISQLPVTKGDYKSHIANRLFAIWKKGYHLAAYDEKGEDAIRALYEHMATRYHQLQDVRIPLLTPDGKLIKQNHLIEILNDSRKSPALVVCTSPVLAYALEHNYTYLFNLDEIKDEIKSVPNNGKESTLLAKVNKCFIHTSLNINISEDKFVGMTKKAKSDIVRLASMVLFAAQKISQEPQTFIDYVFGNSMFNPYDGKDRQLSKETIGEAITNSYIYSPLKYYNDYFYKNDADYRLTMDKHNFSQTLFQDVQEKFDQLLVKLASTKDEVCREVTVEIKTYINLIHSEIVKVLTREKLTIDFYNHANDIVKDAEIFFRNVVKDEKEKRRSERLSNKPHVYTRQLN